jgi:phage major head subunit gpT-like protein
VWRQIASINASVQDFREYETYAWTGDLAFEKLAPAGKIKHGVADDQVYTNQVDTYARMLQVSRKDIINDDIGIIQSGMRKLGRGGALALNTAFWAEFLSNTGDFFGTGNGNLKTGAGSAFGETGLTGAVQAFREMVGPDSQYVMARIKTLLVPPALEVSAKNWMNSTTVVGGTSKTPGNNPFAGLATVQTSPYLKANSTKWWLIADPADVPVMEMCFLYGQESPTVEQADADFNTLGIQMRAFLDFGCNTQDHRGGVWSAGA